MAEQKASTTTTDRSEVNIEFVYTVDDEIFPAIRTEILKGVTKDKGPSVTGETAKIHKYRHKGGSECLICKRHQQTLAQGKPSSAEDISLKVHNAIQTLLHDEDILDGPPPNSAIVSNSVNKFNRELLKTTCQIMGCKQIHGHLIAEEMFDELNSFLTSHSALHKPSVKLGVKKSTFHLILKQILMKYEYTKPQCIGDFQNATELVDHRCNLIILLGGSSGTGKSTLASLIASRLGISTVLSTDTIRHIMRNFVSREDNPILFCSTYETSKYVQQDPANPLTEKKIALTGFQTQCKYVHPHLMKVIDELVAQNENVVIEGVHLTVDFLMCVMKKYPFCLPFVVYIKNKEKHKERFAVRSKHMTLEPRYNRYVECFDSIRTIHKFFVRKAEKALIPRIDNTNVDKSLGLIHSTIVRCLRKIVKGEPLMDESTNKATMLCQEFNAVTKSGLSSAEAQKIIKSRVNKGEIFKRFFGEPTETPLADSQPAEDEGPKRVHSFDEGEMEQIRMENEAAAAAAEKLKAVPDGALPSDNDTLFTFDSLLRRTPESLPTGAKSVHVTPMLNPVPATVEEIPALSKGQELGPALLVPTKVPTPKPSPGLAPKVPQEVATIQADVLGTLLPPPANAVNNVNAAGTAAALAEEEIRVTSLKVSKSSENLLEETKRRKKGRLDRGALLSKFKRGDLENLGDDDKQSLASGLCSVYSGSVDVNTHGIYTHRLVP